MLVVGIRLILHRKQLSCFNHFKLITCVISAPEIDKWKRCFNQFVYVPSVAKNPDEFSSNDSFINFPSLLYSPLKTGFETCSLFGRYQRVLSVGKSEVRFLTTL